MSKKYAILILLFAGISKTLNAQIVNTGDKLMQDGKIYAVIAVATVILSGIFLFLFYLERKIKKLEEEVNN